MNDSQKRRPAMRDSEARERQAKRRLRSEDPVCHLCGNNDWRVLELHHIAGQAYDKGAKVVVCGNCHAKVGDAQCDHPPGPGKTPSLLEMIGRFLLGWSDICAFVAERFREFGSWLIQLAKSLRTEEVQLP